MTRGFERDFVYRRVTFYTNELFLLHDGKLVKIDKPDSVDAGTNMEAAKEAWVRISEHITNNVPRFAFTLEETSTGTLHSFQVEEDPKGKNAEYNITELEVKLTPQQVKEFSVTKDDNFNKYFPGHKIGMPPPLSDDKVTYADGTKATTDQEASDVVEFLAWASEPHMEDRKRTGVRVVLFLLAFAGLLYAVKRQVWSDKH